jgi:hypothetical protein
MTPTRSGDASSDVGGAERRFATTKPAVPPPRIRTSNSRDANSAAEIVEAGTEAEAMDKGSVRDRRAMRDSITLYAAIMAMVKKTSDYTKLEGL